MVTRPSAILKSAYKPFGQHGGVLHLILKRPKEPHFQFAEQLSWMFSLFSACAESRLAFVDGSGDEGYFATTGTLRVSRSTYDDLEVLMAKMSALSSVGQEDVSEKQISKEIRARICRLIGAECLAEKENGCHMKTLFKGHENIMGTKIEGGLVDDASFAARSSGGQDLAHILELKRHSCLTTGGFQAAGNVADAVSL